MDFQNWKPRAIQWYLEKVLRAPPDVSVLLGNRVRKWAPYVRLDTSALWGAEPLPRQLASIVSFRWRPDPRLVQEQAKQTYKHVIFGGDEDWGDHLAVLYDWHLQRDWEPTALTGPDDERASALMAFTILTRLRYRDLQASSLNLHLPSRVPHIATLVYPLVAKVPVVSMRYFLDLDVPYAFDAIRRAQHPDAGYIIAYLYELLFLQQKVAIALLEYARLADFAARAKRQAHLINAEVNAIMEADLVFTYLKASAEKTIALVGAVYGITDLDAKKDHKSRLRALRSGLPRGFEDVFYMTFLLDIVGAEHLEDLNNYRSGLLHKKGIADLQPHNYVGRAASELPLPKIFGVLHEQHAKNTAGLLAALALLTDDLVRRDPPSFVLDEIPDYLLFLERRAMEESSDDGASSGDATSES